MKRLFADIETAFGIGWFWRPGYKVRIPYSNVLIQPGIICISWKWQGEDKVHNARWNKGDDKRVIEKFKKELEKADEVVFHNGDKFDLPWIRTRALFYGITLTDEHRTFDTLKYCKERAGKGYKFPSNRLNDIAEYLGLGQKLQTEKGLWERITLPCYMPSLAPMTKDYKKALDYMVEYCDNDVVLLEKVYDKLTENITPTIHLGVQRGGNKWDCARCASGNTMINKTKVTKCGQIKVEWYCNDCKKYSHTTSLSVKRQRDEWKFEQKRLKKLKRG